MNDKIGCDQTIKMMRMIIASIMEPVSDSCNRAVNDYLSKDTKVTMLWDEADFILDELRFLNDCLRILEKRTDDSEDEA